MPNLPNKAIGIRPATPEDADFIVWGLATALHIEGDFSPTNPIMREIILREDTLYSWKNAHIAYHAETRTPIGLLIAYDGARYATMRQITMPLLQTAFHTDYNDMDDEAEAGEFYIDSLAVLPEMRHQGIGTRLLQYAIQTAREAHFPAATLAVHPQNAPALALYSRVGFRPAREYFIFGENYYKYTIQPNEQNGTLLDA